MGAMLMKMAVFLEQNVFCIDQKSRWGRRYQILNEIAGGDLDEMIDFQNIKSRDLWYFSRNFLELVMHGYTILNGGDLDENGNSKGEN